MPLTDQQIWTALEVLYDDYRERGPHWPKDKPLLAHYTSIATLEAILKNEEIWLANPLFMNDVQELRFGLQLAGQEFLAADKLFLDACGSAERLNVFTHAFNYHSNAFANVGAFDVYVLCLSVHNAADNDGILSMWRGYGGNGNGAAIVFDTSKLEEVPTSPLMIARVDYATTEDRTKWVRELMARFAKLLKDLNLPTDKLHIAAYALFARLKLFALCSKHSGFGEEREWRVIYLKERDRQGQLHEMCGYHLGPRGPEPKLKMPVKAIAGLTAGDLSLDKIIDRIILGPTLATPLAVSTIQRMLERINRHQLKGRIVASQIPFRGVAY